jgi:hypothetical protein
VRAGCLVVEPWPSSRRDSWLQLSAWRHNLYAGCPGTASVLYDITPRYQPLLTCRRRPQNVVSRFLIATSLLLQTMTQVPGKACAIVRLPRWPQLEATVGPE